jgi:hypothetical protein
MSAAYVPPGFGRFTAFGVTDIVDWSIRAGQRPFALTPCGDALRSRS